MLDQPEQLAEYCRILPRGAGDCQYLARIVFSVTDGNDALWPVVPASTARYGVTLISPAVEAGQEACMHWEFAGGQLTDVNAQRIDLDWFLRNTAAAAGLSVAHGGEAHSSRVLAAAANGANRRFFWVPRVSAAPDYWLRFCFRSGEQDASRLGDGAVTGLAIRRFWDPLQ